MEIINPKSVTKIKAARELILDLQKRLFRCEQALDDLARSAEIADITKQTQLMQSFVDAAQVCLEDRLTMPEVSQEDLDRPNIIIEDDRAKVSTQPA
jgi:aminoglycoside/choline kinase family phosphotransferase